MGQKLRSQKKFGSNFQVTIVYLKANTKLKNKFFKNILTQKSEKHFLAPKWGADLHTRSTYTQVNTVLALKKKALYVLSLITINLL